MGFKFLVEQVQCSGDLCGYGLEFRVQFRLEFSKDRVPFLFAISDSWRAWTRHVISSRLLRWELVMLCVLLERSLDFKTIFGRVILGL